MTQAASGNVALMRDLYGAFGRGDVPKILSAMDDKIEWREAEGNPWDAGKAFVGVEEVLEKVFARIAGEFDGFTIELHRLVADGDTVVMEGRYHAAAHHATGKPLDAAVAHVWDLRDGKVVRFQQYTDTRQLADVMGVSPY